MPQSTLISIPGLPISIPGPPISIPGPPFLFLGLPFLFLGLPFLFLGLPFLFLAFPFLFLACQFLFLGRISSLFSPRRLRRRNFSDFHRGACGAANYRFFVAAPAAPQSPPFLEPSAPQALTCAQVLVQYIHCVILSASIPEWPIQYICDFLHTQMHVCIIPVYTTPCVRTTQLRVIYVHVCTFANMHTPRRHLHLHVLGIPRLDEQIKKCTRANPGPTLGKGI
jgi:hypothetical protein